MRYLSPCALSFLPTQACRGKALQLVRDLPVEFHCNKGSYSYWRLHCSKELESKWRDTILKRIFLQRYQAVDSMQRFSALSSHFPLLLFCHLSSSVALQCGRMDQSWPLLQGLSAEGLNSWPRIFTCCLQWVGTGVSVAYLTHIACAYVHADTVPSLCVAANPVSGRLLAESCLHFFALSLNTLSSLQLFRSSPYVTTHPRLFQHIITCTLEWRAWVKSWITLDR